MNQEKEVEDLSKRFPRLHDHLHSQAGVLSGGEQQMLAMARGLISKSDIHGLRRTCQGLAIADCGYFL